LKVSTNVKIVMQCFENFGGEMPPLVARLDRIKNKPQNLLIMRAVQPGV